jgi:CheY-like chemotaxis protein
VGFSYGQNTIRIDSFGVGDGVYGVILLFVVWRSLLNCWNLQHKEKSPGVIFLDQMMPKMDNFEFIEELKKNFEHRSTPIVVFT